MTTAAAIHEDAEFRAALALLETQIEGDLATHVVPGLSASVTCGAETVWQRGFGLADLERKTPAAPDTVYAVGSITKLFTATMLMQHRWEVGAHWAGRRRGRLAGTSAFDAEGTFTT